jgi:hypothetical protein
MPEIIALRGNSDNGKSKTLNIVYQYLLMFGFAQIPGKFRPLGDRSQYDFIDILEKKGLKVGIATMGDYQITVRRNPVDSVENLIDYLAAEGCDKIVCAVNIGLNNALNHISSHKHSFVDKIISPTDDLERIKNGEDAEQIYKLI